MRRSLAGEGRVVFTQEAGLSEAHALPADDVRRRPRDRTSEATERHMRVLGAAVQTRQNCGRVT